MTIRWEKQGQIFVPSGEGTFKTHAARPIPYRLNDTALRIFFSSRDHDDRMLPTFVDVSLEDPSTILGGNEEPLADLGGIGTFDDSGVTLGSIVDHDDRKLVYYTGWKRRRINVSFEMAIGLFDWRPPDPALYRRYRGPILAQDKVHPFLVAGPFVLFDDGRFKMWYCSGTEWRTIDDRPEPIYTVFYAESDDGIDWKPHEGPVVDYAFDGEVVSAPWVVRTSDRYRMWYSTRGYQTSDAKNYVIGYAESADGIHWDRRDEEAGISRSSEGWDSEMICYPALFPYRDKVYMFYSGNGVGKGGLGYAVAENFPT